MVEETGSQAKTGLGMRRLVGRIIIISLVILCLSVCRQKKIEDANAEKNAMQILQQRSRKGQRNTVI